MLFLHWETRLSCHWVLTHPRRYATRFYYWLFLCVVISFITYFLLQAYKIESSSRSLTAILISPVGFTKMTSYSLLIYLPKVATQKMDTLYYIMSLTSIANFSHILLTAKLKYSFVCVLYNVNRYVLINLRFGACQSRPVRWYTRPLCSREFPRSLYRWLHVAALCVWALTRVFTKASKKTID